MTSDSDLDSDTWQRLPKAERVYRILRQRIRDLELAPGVPLRKDELSVELGVSRAPISEAIARLAEEGLVDVFPQHGSFVAAIRPADVREGLFIRTGLEVEAMRRIAQSASAAEIALLDANIAAQTASLAAGDSQRFYELDEVLHELIFQHIDHPRARSFLNSSRAQLDRVRRFVLPAEGRPQATLAEHKRIVEAIRMADPDYAAAAMRSHLASVAATIEARLSALEGELAGARER
jgi:DNA-binding GntR family transcriptional regulator